MSDLSTQSMSSDHAISIPRETRPDHQAFVKELVAGKESAWTSFHTRYCHRLQAYLRSRWQGPDFHLDDLLQLTLLRTVKHISRAQSLPSEEAFWSWLTVLARSTVADYGRKTSRFQNFLRRFSLEPNVEPTPSTDLQPAIQKLDSDSRKLLRLKYEDELSVREIATLLNLSEKAVESRLSRIRKKLRNFLKP